MGKKLSNMCPNDGNYNNNLEYSSFDAYYFVRKRIRTLDII